jgi:hypothetical protein
MTGHGSPRDHESQLPAKSWPSRESVKIAMHNLGGLAPDIVHNSGRNLRMCMRTTAKILQANPDDQW